MEILHATEEEGSKERAWIWMEPETVVKRASQVEVVWEGSEGVERKGERESEERRKRVDVRMFPFLVATW
jgi:hypothetical protein